ncbi:hypothetical protein J4210_03165 [Candidatus Woesearchaeota archaeon]|nr:hypothetical protein [Candidatus Woesearchaeota archaeon]
MSLIDILVTLILSAPPTLKTATLVEYALEHGQTVQEMSCTRVDRTEFCAIREDRSYSLEIRKGSQKAVYVGISTETDRAGVLDMYRDDELLFDRALPDSYRDMNRAHASAERLVNNLSKRLK